MGALGASSGTAGLVQLICTPIGNLGDMTFRAVDCLRAADIIACEDTRHSLRLLSHYEIKPRQLISLHDHNEKVRAIELAERIAGSGENLAFLSDAGAPAISDPGFPLVQECVKRGIRIEVLPGASAVLTGLIGSGLPTDRFQYLGFLPVKSGKREKILTLAVEAEGTTVFFESPHRILKTLTALASIMPTKQICVARELTKKFESYHRGTAQELFEEFAAVDSIRGEITLIISGVTRSQKKQPKTNKYPRKATDSI